MKYEAYVTITFTVENDALSTSYAALRPLKGEGF
jgi:hypothetical protein